MDIWLGDEPADVRHHVAEDKLDYATHLMDPEEKAKDAFDFWMAPHVAVLDAEGGLVYSGGRLDPKELEETVGPLVAGGQGTPKPPDR